MTFAQRAGICLAVTVAAATGHELVHIAVGHAVGLGGHFTNLTAADADPVRRLGATPAARAWMAGSAPAITALTGIIALLAAPWARRRRYPLAATILGWLALFGVPYIGLQLMSLGGPAAGVDTAAVLVDYAGVAGLSRAMVVVAGAVFLIGSGYLLGGALGDGMPATIAPDAAAPPAARHTAGALMRVLSVCLIVAGAVLLARPGHPNAAGAFLLADVLWGFGMLLLTPWNRPGPRFVRDEWLLPATAAMGVLTIVGLLFPSDYSAAGVFFLPQLATAAYATRDWIPQRS